MVNNAYALSTCVALALLLCGCAGQKAPETQTTTTAALYTAPPSTGQQDSTPISLGEYSAGNDRITYAGMIAGKMAYIITKDAKRTIFYDGKQIGGEYDSAVMPAMIGKKFFYAAVKDNKYYTVYDGQKTGDGYFMIWSPGEYEGTPVYVAEKAGKSVLVYDGKEQNSSYDYVWSYDVVAGKLAYTASNIGETYASGRISPQTAESRRDVPPEGVKSVINYDGKEIGRNYDTALFPREVSGGLAYVALKDGKKFIVYGGLEGVRYDDIFEPLLYDGKLAYVALKAQKSVLVYDERAVAEYDDIDGSSLKEIEGKLAYLASDASKKNGKYFAVYGTDEYGREYDNVLSFAASANKRAYVAEKKGKKFVVYEGREIGKTYDYVDPESLAFLDGKLFFIAQKGGAWYIIKED